MLLQINGSTIALAHTVCAYAAFFSALAVGSFLHYQKIIENEFYSYPDEWFPSVSATIGDRYPERSIFQILIALTAGPRFCLVLFTWLATDGGKTATVGLVSGVIRTFTCGGWVYITSTDDHDWHDIFMISYIVLTIPWDVCVILATDDAALRKRRKYTCWSFFGMLVPLITLFIRHKVHRVAGAYSWYALCEWSLILLDVGFDAWSIAGFKKITLSVQVEGSKAQFFGSVSANKEINAAADDIAAVTKLDKSLSRTDKRAKVSSANAAFPTMAIAVHTINSFIFWSTLTGLLAQIWYFPLWNMGISGYEASLAAVLAPVVLLVPGLRTPFMALPQMSRLLATAFGVGAFLFPKPENRVIVSAVGVAFGTVAMAVEAYSAANSSSAANNKDDVNVARYYSVCFVAGVLLHGVVKFAFATNNPIWPIMNHTNGGWNNTGLVVGAICALLTPKYSAQKKLTSSSSSSDSGSGSPLLAAAGLGASIFFLHALATDSSTIITWVWDGYPVHGPLPVPHGAVTLAAFAAAVYASVAFPQSLVTSWINYAAGSIGLVFLIAFKGWIGYVGGIACLFTAISITPALLQAVSKFQPGAAFSLSYLVYIVYTLGSVWIVAYAFVPGGPLLRERTDIVYGGAWVFIGLGLWNTKMGASREKAEKKAPSDATSGIVTKFRWLIISLVAVSVSTAFVRFPYSDPVPFNPESKSFTAGIWTIHFGLDNDMWASEDRMRDLMKDLEVDIMGLLESDSQRIVMGNRDLTQKIAQDLGYYTDFGPGPNKHTWGACLFSKFPIINSTHHLLPSPVGELAPAIHATLDIYGEYVDVFVFHSGQEEDVEDRRLQTQYLSNLMGSTKRPSVLLSYLVTEPLKGNYNKYVSEISGMHDIDPSDDDRWCEYILFKKLRRVGYARVSRGTITDTEVQVGKFMLAKPGDDLYSYQRISEEYVPENLRFPELFKGEGVRGHQYHVFDEPRYFS